MPEASIIIRTFNEQKYLPGLLKAIRGQSCREVEVIVVDSGSVDRTREIAQAFCDRVLRIERRDFTFGYSLNVGIQNSTSRYIAIVSAHTKPVETTWLDRLVEPLRGDRTAMVYGRQVGWMSSKFSEVQDFYRTFGTSREILTPPHFFANNANSAIRRDLWEQHRFDEALPGLEDIEWAKHWMERGYEVVYEPEAAIYHIHEETWPQVQRRYYREAVAARWIGIKGRPQIPFELMSEGKNLVVDLFRAAIDRCLVEKSREIVQFRFRKTVGAVKGLWDGAVMGDLRKRDALFFDKTCKAVVIHGPGRASLEEVEIPSIKPGEVLIKVAYEGVCATDVDMFDGKLGYYKSGLGKYPIIPGHEFSGRAARLGPNVRHLHEGDAVIAECIQGCGECEACRHDNWITCTQRKEMGVIGRNGAYAEYVVVPGQFAHKLPDEADLRKACLCEPIAVVLKGLARLERAWGGGAQKQCAVVGGGPIGHLCARILSLRGHDVTVFDRNPLRRSYFEGTAIRAAEGLEKLSAYEVLVEATGDPHALDDMLYHSAPGSSLLLLGLPYAKREFSFESVVAYDRTIIGSVGSSAREFREAVGIVPRLDLSQFVGKVFPLEGFREAWEESRARRSLKVLLEVDESLNTRS